MMLNQLMVYTRLMVLVITACFVTACGPYLESKPELQVGSALPITVDMPDDEAQGAKGTVYYRTEGESNYRSKPLERRGSTLSAMLPTDNLRPNQIMLYYVAVDGAKKSYSLGSASNPYSTKFVSHKNWVRDSIRLDADYSDNHNSVTFRLTSQHAPIERAWLYYKRPGVRGEIKTEMDDSYGDYTVVIPKKHVQTGKWHYYVEARIENQNYRIPGRGQRSFEVTKAEKQ